MRRLTPATLCRIPARRLLLDRRGGVAIIFAIAFPILALLVAGGVDLAAVSATKASAQAAVDAAALAAAKQLGVGGSSGIPARAEQLVSDQLKQPNLTYAVTTTVDETLGSVTVSLAGNRPSFFANLIPPGGWNVNASATATTMGLVPLCVLSSGAADKDRIEFKDKSTLTAPKCLVHSNGSIKVSSGSLLKAASVQAAIKAEGAIQPTAQVGAPAIDDPFASLHINPDIKTCPAMPKMPKGGPTGTTPLTVPPGVHCGDILVTSGQEVRLEAGEHYFKQGKLKVESNGILRGDDVVLIFDKESDFQFTDKATISLEGRRSGVFEGFVLMTTRENDRTFDIASDSANKFLGTIYVPNATLLVRGAGNRVADQSDWTVVVAKAVKLEGDPKLVINSNYAGSVVPVPSGVGNNMGAMLKH